MIKTLVTGADGFVGSHLTELLARSGFEVKALALYNSFNNWGWLENIDCRAEIQVVSGDVRDPFFCKEVTKGIDIVFHLAALIAIPYSYVAPSSYVDTNVTGTLNICKAALENGVGRVVHISTSEVYGSARYVPIDEEHPLQPQSPYSASKIGADAIALSFFHAFKLPVSIARPFNTYGPRQSARAIIPTIITQLASGSRQVRLGDVRPTRDFNFVTDTCRGMLAVAQCEEAIGEAVNIGSNAEISIGDIFKLVRDLMKSDAELFVEDGRLRPAGSEVTRLLCDNTKIRMLTGFFPQVSLTDGLNLTIDWFRHPANLARYKSDIYNV